MADSAYEIKETVRELEERATFETRRSVLNRITALKLYRLFVEAGEPNPIEYTANAVGIKAGSVEKWLGIYKQSGFEGLLAFGQASRTAPRRAAKSRGAGSERASRKQENKGDSTSQVLGMTADPVGGGSPQMAEDARPADSDSHDGGTQGKQPAPHDLSGQLSPAACTFRAADGASRAAADASRRFDDVDRRAERASYGADSSIRQDQGDSFYSQIAWSKRPIPEAGSDSSAGENTMSVDQPVIQAGDSDGSTTVDGDRRVPGYRESLSRAARRARLRARVSRRAISRLRRGRTTREDGTAHEGRESGSSESDRIPDAQSTPSANVTGDAREQSAGIDAPAKASLPSRADRGSLYRPKEKFAASSGHAFANARVLIAEPDDLITDIIRHRLEKQGANVTSAIDGVEVVSRFWSTTFDLVIVAAALPGLDGFEIVRWLRDHQTNSGVPILITSWPGNESDLVRAFDAGADDFLRKPFSPAEMVARSRRLLERVGGWDPVPANGESSESGRESDDE